MGSICLWCCRGVCASLLQACEGNPVKRPGAFPMQTSCALIAVSPLIPSPLWTPKLRLIGGCRVADPGTSSRRSSPAAKVRAPPGLDNRGGLIPILTWVWTAGPGEFPVTHACVGSQPHHDHDVPGAHSHDGSEGGPTLCGSVVHMEKSPGSSYALTTTCGLGLSWSLLLRGCG